jgi:hypothetical protein
VSLAPSFESEFPGLNQESYRRDQRLASTRSPKPPGRGHRRPAVAESWSAPRPRSTPFGRPGQGQGGGGEGGGGGGGDLVRLPDGVEHVKKYSERFAAESQTSSSPLAHAKELKSIYGEDTASVRGPLHIEKRESTSIGPGGRGDDFHRLPPGSKKAGFVRSPPADAGGPFVPAGPARGPVSRDGGRSPPSSATSRRVLPLMAFSGIEEIDRPWRPHRDSWTPRLPGAAACPRRLRERSPQPHRAVHRQALQCAGVRRRRADRYDGTNPTIDISAGCPGAEAAPSAQEDSRRLEEDRKYPETSSTRRLRYTPAGLRGGQIAARPTACASPNAQAGSEKATASSGHPRGRRHRRSELSIINATGLFAKILGRSGAALDAKRDCEAPPPEAGALPQVFQNVLNGAEALDRDIPSAGESSTRGLLHRRGAISARLPDVTALCERTGSCPGPKSSPKPSRCPEDRHPPGGEPRNPRHLNSIIESFDDGENKA